MAPIDLRRRRVGSESSDYDKFSPKVKRILKVPRYMNLRFGHK